MIDPNKAMTEIAKISPCSGIIYIIALQKKQIMQFKYIIFSLETSCTTLPCYGFEFFPG
jgi:hypothetical protein